MVGTAGLVIKVPCHAVLASETIELSGHYGRSGTELLATGWWSRSTATSQVRRLKGKSRPVQTELARAAVLACLDMVDLVVIFGETTPIALVEAVQHNLLVKGADYRLDDFIGSDLVQSYGGKVLLAELREGFSTTDVITRIRGLGSRHDRRLPGRVIGSA